MRAIALIAVTALLLAPTVAEAQTALPVDQCARECEPKDVNGPAYKVGREPVTQFLYAHFEDILNMAPLNTQAPDPVREVDLNRGFLMPVIDTNTGVCVPPGGSTCADFHFKNNQFVLYSSPALVEYLEEGWRTHQEPQLNYDIELAAQELTLYWYMSANAPGPNPGPTGAVPSPIGIMPFVDVYARMETGRFPYRGELIAESPFAPDTLDQRTTMVSLPGEDAVYEFKIEMGVKKSVIPGDALGFLVVVQPYQIATDNHDGVEAAQPNWQLRSGATFPNRVLLPTYEPIKTFGSGGAIRGDDLWIWWDYAPALGLYDRRDDLRKLTLNGNATIDPAAVMDVTPPDAYHAHGFDDQNATWRIDLRKVSLPDGHYELEASIPTLQDTYLLRQSFPFEVKSGQVLLPETASFEGDAAPGAPFVGLLLALALLVALRRR